MVLNYIGITFVVTMLMGVPIAFILGLIPLGYLILFSNMEMIPVMKGAVLKRGKR